MAALPLLAPSPTVPLLAPPAAAGLILVLSLASPDDMRGRDAFLFSGLQLEPHTLRLMPSFPVENVARPREQRVAPRVVHMFEYVRVWMRAVPHLATPPA